MNKKTIETLLKVNVACIFITLIMWFITIYPKYQGHFNAANNIVLYGMTACSMLAIFYILFGFNKQYGSTVYKLFLYVFTFIQLTTLLNHEYQTVHEVITTAIRFGCLTLLSFGNDLGEKKSKIIVSILIGATLVDVCEVLYLGALQYAYKGLLNELTLEITVLLLIFAKYIDKKERGAKI